MKRILISKFALQYPADVAEEVPFSLLSLFELIMFWKWKALIRDVRRSHLLFVSNPQFAELIFAYAVRLLFGGGLKIAYFDLILKKPEGFVESVAARIKRTLLAASDLVICIHKDTSGYEKYFGISKKKCVYVPFKANNFDFLNDFAAVDGDYVLSLGASHRDYKLLIEAVNGSDIPVKIVLPLSSIKAHNANIAGIMLPPNVEHITSYVDRYGWSKYIAESRFVVVPLLPDVLQPAGISVYLEAMALGKPVIVSRGSSTEGILNNELAMLVPAGEVEPMRRAIAHLWNNADLRARLSHAGCEYARSLKNHSRLLEDVRRVLTPLLS